MSRAFLGILSRVLLVIFTFVLIVARSRAYRPDNIGRVP